MSFEKKIKEVNKDISDIEKLLIIIKNNKELLDKYNIEIVVKTNS